MASRSMRAASVRADAGRSTDVVRVGDALRVTGDAARLESAAGARVVLISGRVRTDAAGSERVTVGRVWIGVVRLVSGVRVTVAGDREVAVRDGVGAGVAGRVTTGALRLVSARVVAAGGWTTGARGVATDGATGRVTTGAVRVWVG
jgi:hypothetical protein